MSISGVPCSFPQCHYIGIGIWKWRFFFGFWLDEEFLALSFAFAGADELEAASPDVLEALSFNWVGAGAGTSLGFTAASAERGAG